MSDRQKNNKIKIIEGVKMIKWNKNNKRAKQWLTGEVEGYKLSDVYGSYSKNKERAFRDCKDLCEDKNGWGLCIIAHNANYFTVKFTTDEGIYIITKSNNYFIEN